MSISRSNFTAGLALSLICLTAADASSQQLRTGDRIRVKTLTGDVAEQIGTFQSSEPEYLVFSTSQSARVQIPWDNLSRLESSRGVHSNAGTGALIGGGIGGALGLTFGLICSGGGDSCWGEYSAGDVLLATAMLGAMGAGVGALIGLAIKSEKWEDVPREQWRIEVEPDPRGGVAIGLNLRL